VLHVDFQRVDETTRLRKKVPLHFSGEENSVAVKTDKCLVSHVATELEIECLATQLPEFVAIDLSGLVKGQSLHASDLKLPEGIKAVKHGTLNPVIVSVPPCRRSRKKSPRRRWWPRPTRARARARRTRSRTRSDVPALRLQRHHHPRQGPRSGALFFWGAAPPAAGRGPPGRS
jgi:hypothetical protein